jgi:hypothetical protein
MGWLAIGYQLSAVGYQLANSELSTCRLAVSEKLIADS